MKNHISKKTLREFGLLIGFGIPLMIGFLIPIIFGHSFRVWTLFVGLSAITFGLCSPKILYYPYKFWMLLGDCLGWINSRLILGIVFLIVLQPIALIMRILKYDPLQKKWNNNKSYREIKKIKFFDLNKIF